MDKFGTKVQCRLFSKGGWMCNLPQGHKGDTHVALGIGDRVIEVWTLETVTETREKVNFLKESE